MVSLKIRKSNERTYISSSDDPQEMHMMQLPVERGVFQIFHRGRWTQIKCNGKGRFKHVVLNGFALSCKNSKMSVVFYDCIIR